MRSAACIALALFAASGCAGNGQRGADAGVADDGGSGSGADGGAGGGAGGSGGGGSSDGGAGGDLAAPCTTRIDYGGAWIHPAGHASSFDVTDGVVTWDRTCHDDGANSYAQLSNGWKPYFTGNGACSLTLDYGSCGVYANPVIPQGCA